VEGGRISSSSTKGKKEKRKKRKRLCLVLGTRHRENGKGEERERSGAHFLLQSEKKRGKGKKENLPFSPKRKGKENRRGEKGVLAGGQEKERIRRGQDKKREIATTRAALVGGEKSV